MAGARGRPPLPVVEALRRHPAAFSFFQAVRVLEQRARIRARDAGLAPGVEAGGDGRPGEEAVRIRAEQSLSFPAAEIARAAASDEMQASTAAPDQTVLNVSFMGLTGPSGALPQHYTEMVIANLRAKSPAMRDFFDLFNHRGVSLFYRAWLKYRLPIAYEAAGGRGEDPISRLLFALVGLGTPHLRDRLAIDDQTLIHYGGLFGHAPRSASALIAMLSDYFGRPIRIDQFHGHWLQLVADDTSLLPTKALPEGRFCRLGVDAVVGDRVWDVQSRFRIRIGPLAYEEFRQFMPDGSDLQRLAHLTRMFVGPALRFEVQLTLAGAEVPECRLGGEAGGSRLGWNAWLKDRPFLEDATEAVFSPDGFVHSSRVPQTEAT